MRCQRGRYDAIGRDAVPAGHQLQGQAPATGSRWPHPRPHRPERNGDGSGEGTRGSIWALATRIPPATQKTTSCLGPAGEAPTELFLTPKPGDNSALRCCLTFCAMYFFSGSWNGDVTPGAEVLDKQGFSFRAGANPCSTPSRCYGHVLPVHGSVAVPARSLCPPCHGTPGMEELLSILYAPGQGKQGRGVPVGLTSAASPGCWDEPDLRLHQGWGPCRREKKI